MWCRAKQTQEVQILCSLLHCSRKSSHLPKHSWVGKGLGPLIGDMTLVTAHCHRKVSSLGWEEEFPVFILTFCLLLALGLTGIGRIMAVSVWKQCQGRSLERGLECRAGKTDTLCLPILGCRHWQWEPWGYRSGHSVCPLAHSVQVMAIEKGYRLDEFCSPSKPIEAYSYLGQKEDISDQENGLGS